MLWGGIQFSRRASVLHEGGSQDKSLASLGRAEKNSCLKSWEEYLPINVDKTEPDGPSI